MADRDNLTTRTIPFMELSDGSDASLTAPPAPLPHYLNAEGRAIARFAVEGNVVSKSLSISWSYCPRVREKFRMFSWLNYDHRGINDLDGGCDLCARTHQEWQAYSPLKKGEERSYPT
jgi:hypothetical protein